MAISAKITRITTKAGSPAAPVEHEPRYVRSGADRARDGHRVVLSWNERTVMADRELVSR